MSGSTEWIGGGESIGLDNSVADTLSRELSESQLLQRDNATSTGKTVDSQVSEDAQVNTSTGDSLDMRRKTLTGSVNGISAHRVTHVIDEVNDEERADGRVIDDANFEVTGTSAEFLENRIDLVGFGDEFILLLKNSKSGVVDVRQFEDLHLTDHSGFSCRGLEATSFEIINTEINNQIIRKAKFFTPLTHIKPTVTTQRS